MITIVLHNKKMNKVFTFKHTLLFHINSFNNTRKQYWNSSNKKLDNSRQNSLNVFLHNSLKLKKKRINISDWQSENANGELFLLKFCNFNLFLYENVCLYPVKRIDYNDISILKTCFMKLLADICYFTLVSHCFVAFNLHSEAWMSFSQ